MSDYVPDSTDAEASKVIAIIGYFGILVLVPLLMGKESDFAKFHAGQSLILICCTLPLMIIPLVNLLAILAFWCLAIYGMIQAAGGKATPLPVIGGWAFIKPDNS